MSGTNGNPGAATSRVRPSLPKIDHSGAPLPAVFTSSVPAEPDPPAEPVVEPAPGPEPAEDPFADCGIAEPPALSEVAAGLSCLQATSKPAASNNCLIIE